LIDGDGDSLFQRYEDEDLLLPLQCMLQLHQQACYLRDCQMKLSDQKQALRGSYHEKRWGEHDCNEKGMK
jgi:hypothetical protein